MVALVEELKHRYPSRFVVFDLPPLLHTADVLAFSPYTDALLMVVEEGKTTRRRASACSRVGQRLTSRSGNSIEQSRSVIVEPCRYEGHVVFVVSTEQLEKQYDV